jgi:hypothetical protein
MNFEYLFPQEIINMPVMGMGRILNLRADAGEEI